LFHSIAALGGTWAAAPLQSSGPEINAASAVQIRSMRFSRSGFISEGAPPAGFGSSVGSQLSKTEGATGLFPKEF